jgi:hypothetical protein
MLLQMISLAVCALVGQEQGAQQAPIDYKVLATVRTSTMEKELNRAAEQGYRFRAVMGGETAGGGNEVVVVMARDGAPGRFAYRLLATSKTSTMQKELQQAADAGFEYQGQTVFESALAGREVVVILERDKERGEERSEYRLQATSRTSTLEKELRQLGPLGFQVLGLTVAETAMGGNELVAIARRPKSMN